MRLCPACNTAKPQADFRSHDRRKCRACEAADSRARRRSALPEFDIDVVDPDPTPPAVPMWGDAPTVDSVLEARDSVARTRIATAEAKLLAEEVKRLRAMVETFQAVPAAAPVIRAVGAPLKGEAVPILQAGDWHIEEEVDPDKVHGLNRYNLDEAFRRAALFFANGIKLCEIAARDSDVRRVVIDLGGDFITGSIHDENLETAQVGPTRAIALCRDMLLDGIRQVRAAGFEVDVVCVVGNHGRTTKKLRIATAIEHNLEWLMYVWLANDLAQEQGIRVHVSAGTTAYVDIFPSYRVRVIHGYEVRGGGGVGGISVPLNKWVYRSDTSIKANLTLVHHFHQRMDGGSFLLNGSLIGYNAYAQLNGFSPEPPQQQFALIHSRDGGVKSIVAPIWVTP